MYFEVNLNTVEKTIKAIKGMGGNVEIGRVMFRAEDWMAHFPTRDISRGIGGKNVYLITEDLRRGFVRIFLAEKKENEVVDTTRQPTPTKNVKPGKGLK